MTSTAPATADRKQLTIKIRLIPLTQKTNVPTFAFGLGREISGEIRQAVVKKHSL